MFIHVGRSVCVGVSAVMSSPVCELSVKPDKHSPQGVSGENRLNDSPIKDTKHCAHRFKCHGESENQTEVSQAEEIFYFTASCEYLTRNMRQLRSERVIINFESTAVLNIFALVAAFQP